MKFEKYHKPSRGNDTGMTKGVKTGQMKVYFQDGRNPYKVGQILQVKFKGEKKLGLVDKVTDFGVTVTIDGIDKKKSIRYNNVISIVQ
jgi:hypothetical protein